LFPEEVAKSFRAYDAAMLASGKAVRNQETLVYPDGRSVLVETLKAPWIGSDGKPRGLVGICVEREAPAAPTTP
ncbi:MAG: PAS domain-containing protein, partial [Planctomycetota bacterium]